MANLFKDLPHLLGTITNLDGAQSMRARPLSMRRSIVGSGSLANMGSTISTNTKKKFKLGEATGTASSPLLDQ